METWEKWGRKGRFFSQIWLSASCVELQCMEKAIWKTGSIRVQCGQGKGWLFPKQRPIISYRLIRFFYCCCFLLFFLALIMNISQEWSIFSSPVPIFPFYSHGRSYWQIAAPFPLCWYWSQAFCPVLQKPLMSSRSWFSGWDLPTLSKPQRNCVFMNQFTTHSRYIQNICWTNEGPWLVIETW